MYIRTWLWTAALVWCEVSACSDEDQDVVEAAERYFGDVFLQKTIWAAGVAMEFLCLLAAFASQLQFWIKEATFWHSSHLFWVTASGVSGKMCKSDLKDSFDAAVPSDARGSALRVWKKSNYSDAAVVLVDLLHGRVPHICGNVSRSEFITSSKFMFFLRSKLAEQTCTYWNADCSFQSSVLDRCWRKNKVWIKALCPEEPEGKVINIVVLRAMIWGFSTDCYRLGLVLLYSRFLLFHH